MEDTKRVFEDRLQKGRTGHFAEKDLKKKNRKHRPKARERQAEKKRDHCG